MRLQSKRTYHFELHVFYHDKALAEKERASTPARLRQAKKLASKPTRRTKKKLAKSVFSLTSKPTVKRGRRSKLTPTRFLLSGGLPEHTQAKQYPINQCKVLKDIRISTKRLGVSRIEYFKQFIHKMFLLLVENTAQVMDPPDGAMVHLVYTGREMHFAHNPNPVPLGGALPLDGKPVATWDRVAGRWFQRLTKHEEALITADRPKRGSHGTGMRRTATKLLARREVVGV